MSNQSNAIAIDALRAKHSYLIDLGSTLELFGEATDQFLKGAGRQWNQAIACWNGKTNFGSPEIQRSTAWTCVAQAATREIQRAVEIMVTADQIAFDGILTVDPKKLGFNLSQSWAFQKGILRPVEIAKEQRQERLKELIQISSDLSKLNDLPLWHQGDKTCHDYGFDLTSGISWFADSGDHPLRAIYYMHLSELAGVPVFMSEAKLRYLDKLLDLGIQRNHKIVDAHKKVKKHIVRESIPSDDILPPIFETVVVYALKKEISPGQALWEVRKSEEAKSYRQKLVDLRKQLTSLNLSHQEIANRYLDGLKSLAAGWSTNREMTGTNYMVVKELLRLIPKVGGLLARILPSQIDKLFHKPDPVHLFVSRWFKVDEEKLDGFQ